jgi:ubiquinone biosynthesis protein UbiJ
MFATLNSVLAPAVMERLTLVVNHILGSESVATARLKTHAGRTLGLVLDRWPALLPAPPACTFRVTPAGLLEWLGAAHEGEAVDLTLRVDAANPAALMSRGLLGERPTAAIEGDTQLAGDVNWLMQNLRWDVADDLERLFGPLVAQQMHRLGSALAAALRAALQGAGQLRDRVRPGL